MVTQIRASVVCAGQSPVYTAVFVEEGFRFGVGGKRVIDDNDGFLPTVNSLEESTMTNAQWYLSVRSLPIEYNMYVYVPFVVYSS